LTNEIDCVFYKIIAGGQNDSGRIKCREPLELPHQFKRLFAVQEAGLQPDVFRFSPTFFHNNDFFAATSARKGKMLPSDLPVGGPVLLQGWKYSLIGGEPGT